MPLALADRGAIKTRRPMVLTPSIQWDMLARLVFSEASWMSLLIAGAHARASLGTISFGFVVPTGMPIWVVTSFSLNTPRLSSVTQCNFTGANSQRLLQPRGSLDSPGETATVLVPGPVPPQNLSMNNNEVYITAWKERRRAMRDLRRLRRLDHDMLILDQGNLVNRAKLLLGRRPYRGAAIVAGGRA